VGAVGGAASEGASGAASSGGAVAVAGAISSSFRCAKPHANGESVAYAHCTSVIGSEHWPNRVSFTRAHGGAIADPISAPFSFAVPGAVPVADYYPYAGAYATANLATDAAADFCSVQNGSRDEQHSIGRLQSRRL
jgi:hypothetical protein